MKYRKYPARDPIKNYFPLPNELFDLELPPGAIALYACLMRFEDRKTFECLMSYGDLGRHLNMNKKTVSKYVAVLEENKLIRTEHTSIFTKDGRKYNGCLRYKILPIQGAINYHTEYKLALLERDTARYNAKKAWEAANQQCQNSPLSPLS